MSYNISITETKTPLPSISRVGRNQVSSFRTNETTNDCNTLLGQCVTPNFSLHSNADIGATMVKRQTYKPKIDTSQSKGFSIVQRSDVAKAIASRLTGSQLRLWLYLITVEVAVEFTPSGERVYRDLLSLNQIAINIGASNRTVEKDLKVLSDQKLLPEWVVIPRNNANPEARIRDCLHEQLGGLKEVVTPSGRIDLLTDSEIIEVKHVNDWKSAMGQVLAYSGFYPEHKKRIHLFGKKRELPTSTAITICNELGIIVTFEEVQ